MYRATLLGQLAGCVSFWLLVKINPVPAKRRTTVKNVNSNNNNTDKHKRIHRATLSQPNAPHAPEPWLTSPGPAPPPRVEHDCTWYQIPLMFGQFGSSVPAVSPPGFWWTLALSWTNPGSVVTYHDTRIPFPLPSSLPTQKSEARWMCQTYSIWAD